MNETNEFGIEDWFKFTSTDALVHHICGLWIDQAEYREVDLIRRHRFELLLTIQSFFEQCDPYIIKPILDGLITRVHGQDYSCIGDNFNSPIRLFDKIKIACLQCSEYSPSIDNKFDITLKDLLLPAEGHSIPCGCPNCLNRQATGSGGYRKKNTSGYIVDCEIKHGKKFDYRLTKYTNSRSNSTSEITIICRECEAEQYPADNPGIFIRRAGEHIRCIDCPLCRKRKWGERTRRVMSNPETKAKHRNSIINRDRTLPASVYYVKINKPGMDTMYKIGYTSRPINKRLTEMSKHTDVTVELLLDCRFKNGMGAESLETTIINDAELQKYRYKPMNNSTRNGKIIPPILFRGEGDNEIFTTDIRVAVPRIGKLLESVASNTDAVNNEIKNTAWLSDLAKYDDSKFI